MNHLFFSSSIVSLALASSVLLAAGEPQKLLALEVDKLSGTDVGAAACSEVMFVDDAASGLRCLADNVRTGVDVVMLDAKRDGLAQIENYLNDHRGMRAMHLVSHGQTGAFLLGKAVIDTARVMRESDRWRAIGRDLAPRAEILIYGCETGAGTEGATLVTWMANLTGATVAASTDNTGAAALGGNWKFERVSGSMTSILPWANGSDPVYSGLLAAFSDNFSTDPTGGGFVTTFTRTLGGASFTFTFTTDGDGGVLGYDTLNGVGNSESISAVANAFNTGTTEKLTIKRTDNGDFIFTGIFINNTFSGGTITIGGYKAGSLVGSTQTVGATSSSLSFASLTVDEVRITSPDLSINFDDFAGNTTVNAAPVVTTSGGTTAFTEGNNVTSTPVVVDSGITVTDADNATLASGTVAITGNFQSGQDVLAFANDGSTMGNISGSYTAGTGIYTLTSSGATATTAQWQAALRSVTYTNSSQTPNTSNRTVSFVVNDGTANSSAGTKTVSVTSVNDTPVATASGGTTAFTEGNNVTSTPVVVDSGITISDADNATLASGTVSITGNFQNGEDILAFTNNPATMGNITGSYTGGTGVFSLSSAGATATVAQWQAALRSVTYTDSSDSPNTSNRTISFVVNDGTVDSSATTKTVSVTSTNDTPIATASGGTTAFTEGNNVTSTPVVIDSGITVSDADNTTLASATVTITGNLQSSEDVLAFTNNPATMGNITGSYTAGTGVYALTSAGSTATVGQWQAALRSVTYTDSSDTPNTSNRTISFVVNDGTIDSSATTKTVSVASANDTPVVTASGGTTAFTEGNNVTSTPVAVDAGVTVSDADNTTLASATVTITGNLQTAEDVLAFTNNPATMGNITASYTAGTGVLAMSSAGATATLAQWQAALRSVAYTNSSDTPNTSNRTISFAVNDGSTTSSASTKTVSVASVNDSPVVTASGGTTAFTEGNNVTSTPVVVDSGATVSDADNTTLASATVSITGNPQAAEDVLAFTNNPATMGNISGFFTPGTSTLALTSAGATATVAQWQAALQSVTYTNSSDTPNTSNRTISFVVNDGTIDSSASTKTVSVASVNDTPIATASGGTTAFTEGADVTSTPVVIDGSIALSDLDSTTFASATVVITGNPQTAEDVLAFTNNPATMGNISGVFTAGTSTLALTSAGATATVAQWQAALQSVTYTNSSDTPTTSNRTISFVVNDGSTDSAATTKTVSVTASNDSPTDIALSSSSVNQSSGVNATVGTLSSTDPDSVSFTYSLVAGAGSTNNASFNISGSTLRANDASALAAGSYSVRIRTTDNLSATFDKVFSITVVDNIVPSAPSTPDLATASDSGTSSTDNLTNVNTPTFTGTAEANSTVQLFRGGVTSLGTTTANGSGNWSFTVGSALADGTYSITAKAIDAATNTSVASGALSITIDTTVAAPVFVAITNDTGASSTDQITSDPTLILSGTAEANSSVAVTLVGTGSIGSATANGSGAWSFDYTATTLSAGDHIFRAVATDPAGNVSTASTDFLVTVDTASPGQVTITTISTDTGASSTDGITNDQTLTISGTADANTTVTVNRTGVGALGTATANGSGAWTFNYTGTTLPEGSYIFTATSVDLAGNTGAASAAFPVTIDITAPAAPAITAITTDTGTSATDQITSDATLILTGTAEANATVTVTRSGTGVIGTATANGSGAWSFDYTATTLPVGSHIFTATATDVAGNVSLASGNFTVTVQAAPAISTQPASGAYFSGDTILLSVVATGTGPLAYQWYQDGNALTDTGGRTGSTTATLTQTGATVTGFAGTYTVVVSNTSGTVTSAGAVVTVSPASQTITFPVIADRLTTSAPFALTATASSGLTVAYQVVSGPATVTGSVVTITGAGTVTIRASQAGDANHTAATNVDRSFTVSKATATVTLGSLSATYDGTAKAASAVTSPAGLTVVLTYDGSATAPTSGGSYAVVGTINDATYAGSVSGTLTIAPASQTITFAQPADPFVGVPLTLAATASSGLTVTYSVVSGSATIVNGNQLLAGQTGTIVVRASQSGNGNYNAATAVDRTVTAAIGLPSITTQPTGGTVNEGGSFTLSVTATGVGLSYQWTFNGAPISGATSASLVLNSITQSQSGAYAVVVSNVAGSVTSTSAQVTVAIDNRLINLSSRLRAGTGNKTFICGFIISGNSAKSILIRGVGPGLTQFGVPNVLAHPTLQLFRGSSKIAEAAEWGKQTNLAELTATMQRLGTFPLNTLDSAMLPSLVPGAYTAMITGANGETGASLVEIFDASTETGRLINISTRGESGTGDNVLIAGFIIAGTTPKTVLIRAIGPGLTAYGVDGVLADPALRLYNSAHAVIAENNDWEDSGAGPAVSAASAASGAFPLVHNAKDSALVITLPPGAYTAHGYGKDGGIGIALVEVYEVP